MVKVKTYIQGIYPRSSDLIQVSRDLIRKRRSEEDYFAQLKKDFDELQKVQKLLDMDFVEDGKLDWHDIFRPIVQSTEGFKIGALTRWFDNNCFFRQPIITGNLKLDEKKLDKFFPKLTPGNKWKVTLPSPFTFAKLSFDEKGSSFENRLDKITEIISQVIVYLDKKGVSFIQFNEPFLPYFGITPSDAKLFKNSLIKMGKLKSKQLVAFQFYFGDAAPVIKALPENKFIKIVGVDFYKTALSSLPKDFPYDLAAGIVDGRNSLLENENDMKEFIKKARQFIGDRDLYITNNSDLDLLPETYARKKVDLLAKVGNEK